jgi:putative tricarboxylic transport membrane protein
MDFLNDATTGFAAALTLGNLMYCLVGALLGTLVGILPGISPVVAIAMLLPLTFQLQPLSALIMLSGIYYGASHAGSTTAIMLNMPGEPSAVVICFDGYPMAQQGRAGPALAIAALSSLFAGCACILIIAFLSPPLAKIALAFQAPEYAATIVLALVGVSALSGTSLVKTLAMAAMGIALGTVGTDVTSGTARFTFDDSRLTEGVSFVAIAIGLFAFAEVCAMLGTRTSRPNVLTSLRDLMPSWKDVRASSMPTVRGTAIGVPLGILPGGGPLIASVCSYALEKKLARDPSRFGKGAVEGVAAPEAAANSAAFTSFIPMLALGIPASTTMALMLGGLLIQGIQPGPRLMTQHPDIFWGLVASMWIGNLMLLVLNLPLVGIWIRLLQTPTKYLYPIILAFCCVGIYTFRGQAFDVMIAAGVCVFGYLMAKLDCAPAPLLLGVVLGPMFEENLRRALLVSRGDPSVFVTRPISLGIVLVTMAMLVTFVLPSIKRRFSPATA